MKLSYLWLLALLTVLAPMTISSQAIADEAASHLSGSVEVGASGADITDNPARVNEYTQYSPKSEDLQPNISAALGYENNGYVFDLQSKYRGSDNQEHLFDLDLKRVFRLDFSSMKFQHWKDHETLGQMGATARDDVGGGQPNVTTDKTFADLISAGYPPSVAGENSNTFPYDPVTAYAQEVSDDYLVTRSEYKGDATLTIPALKNVSFHAGARLETREGTEQAISLGKCDSCHISAAGKEIDERTEDFTFGATGRFGAVTIDYEYLTRTFSEDGDTPTRYYIDASHNNADQLNYDNEILPFGRTPDSEKDMHSLRARADLPRNTSITASYVKSDIESSKSQTQGEYDLLGSNRLKSEFESFGGKLSTKVGDNLRLSLRGSQYEIDTSNNEIYFPAREAEATVGSGDWPGDYSDEWLTAEAREVTELGLDAVYRLARGTTLRLGYEYEKVDRDEEELGETETNGFKVSLKSRLNSQWSGNVSYKYEDIDEPLSWKTGIAQGDPMATADPLGSGLWYYDVADFGSPSPIWYWTDVYPNRQLDATSLPDEVHETKANVTWVASPHMSATLFARVRMEENNDVDYEQNTYVPGVSLYYAPNGKMNLTMAYTFNRMETENQMCVGWYHG